MKKWISKNWHWLVLFLSIIVVIEITEEVFKQEIINEDLSFYYFIVNYFRSSGMTKIMEIITMFGSSITIIILSLASYLILKNKRKSYCIIINPLIVTMINQLLKGIVQRKRPSEFFLIMEKGFSFPSGHSMIAVAFYGFIIYLIYKYVKNSKIKTLSITALIFLILLIGFSRIYLGVHYLSDVIAGFFISLGYLIIYIKIVGKYIEKGEVQYEK